MNYESRLYHITINVCKKQYKTKWVYRDGVSVDRGGWGLVAVDGGWLADGSALRVQPKPCECCYCTQRQSRNGHKSAKLDGASIELDLVVLQNSNDQHGDEGPKYARADGHQSRFDRLAVEVADGDTTGNGEQGGDDDEQSANGHVLYPLRSTW